MKFFAGVLYCLAVVLVGFGFKTMYTYGSGSVTAYQGMVGHIVQGDAYNHIIIGLRGLGLICAGILAGVVGAATSICATIAEARASKEQKEEAPTVAETA